MPITIKALQDTSLKKEPIQSADLPDDQKVAVPAGKEYRILAYNPPKDDHTFVTLDYGAGSWYVFNKHFSGLPTSPITVPPPPANTVGPSKTPSDFGFKPGDHHLVVNDVSEKMICYDFSGKRLWTIDALARGQYSDYEYRINSSDTPPGLYRLGQIYDDRNCSGTSSDNASYGWITFDMISLDKGEITTGRAGICTHGGGSSLGYPGWWQPYQPLVPTLGCIRLHNADLEDKILPLTKSGTVFVSVYQEA